MDTQTETNGTTDEAAPAAAAAAPVRGRRRAVASTTTPPAAGDAAAPAATPKRRGPAKGFKRKAQITHVAPAALPEPSSLPIHYLIACGTELKKIRKQLADLAE